MLGERDVVKISLMRMILIDQIFFFFLFERIFLFKHFKFSNFKFTKKLKTIKIVGNTFFFWLQSHQDEELSDPDLQDEESGEELPQQPLQGSNHNSHDTSNNSIGGPMALNNFINPHLLAKFKMDVSEN